MNAKTKKILVIDDSPEDIQFVMENLKDEFAILAATSGQKGLELAAKEPKPDVILMDVVMPEMDGYETCRRLKENPETKDIDIIFVSANETTEEKLAGYDAGGSDYLIKPVQPKELIQKVKLAISNKQAREEVANDKDMAFKTAMTAMTSAGEQGIVLEFLRNSFAINNVKDLAHRLVESTSSYELNNAVQLRTDNEVVNFGSTDPLPPLEADLLTGLKDKGRIIEKDKRAIFNFAGVSVLIKNMPDDDDKRGRLRDHLAILYEGAAAKLDSLNLRQQIARVVEDSHQAFQAIEVEQKAHKKFSQQIMDDMLQDLEAAFMSWGLNEDQEASLVNVVQTGVGKSLDNFEKGLDIDEQMRSIIQRMSQFVKDAD